MPTRVVEFTGKAAALKIDGSFPDRFTGLKWHRPARLGNDGYGLHSA